LTTKTTATKVAIIITATTTPLTNASTQLQGKMYIFCIDSSPLLDWKGEQGIKEEGMYVSTIMMIMCDDHVLMEEFSFNPRRFPYRGSLQTGILVSSQRVIKAH
jgi:hypothetical protein